MEVENKAGVGESVQGVCDAVFLGRVETAYTGDVGFEGGDDPVGVER